MADEEIPPVEEAKAPVQPELPLAEEEAPQEAEATPEKAEEKPAEQEPVAETPAEEPKVDWRDKELPKKHARIKHLERELAEERAKREAAEALATRSLNGETTTNLQPTIPPEKIAAAAAELRAQERYIEDCNKAAQAGEKNYGAEWRTAVQNLELLGGFDPDTMTGLLATDDPAKVLFELGKNPDNYHRIMELPPAKRIIEMGKLAMQPVAPKKVSEAPAPVTPIGGRAAPAASSLALTDNMSDDEAYRVLQAMRKKRVEDRRVSR